MKTTGWVPLLCAVACACGYPQPDRVGAPGDASVADAGDARIADGRPAADAAAAAPATSGPDAAAAAPDARPPAPDAPPACGARGQVCCAGGGCAARAICDGAVCIAADVWASGSGGTYHFDGSWKPSFLGSNNVPFNAIWGTSPTNIVAVGNNGLVARYDGHTWTRDVSEGTDTALTLYSVSGTGTDDIWAGGIDRFAYFNGSSWTSVPFALPNPLSPIDYRGVWLYGRATGFACTAAYSAISQVTAGTWAKSITSASNHELFAIWGASATSGWAVGHGHNLTTGDPAKLMRWDGGTWTVATTLLPTGTPSLGGVWGTDESHVWIVGAAGTVLFYDGSSWTSRFSGSSDYLRAVWGSGPSDVWAVGDGGAIHWNGTAWAPVPGLGAAKTVWLSAQ
jgi:hypothetical protein